jgi:hypothetical protein
VAEKLSEMTAFLFFRTPEATSLLVKTSITSFTFVVRQPLFPKSNFCLNTEPASILLPA